MVDRVATGFQNQASLKQLQENQAAANVSSYQITTGFKSDRLSGFSGEATELLTLYDARANTSTYTQNITTAENRLKSTESALQGMMDVLTEAAGLWTLGRNENSAETRASLAPKAESLTESFYSLLNTEFDGRYIFSGQNSAEQPLSGTPAATAYAAAAPASTWYQGDGVRNSAIIAPGQVFQYGVVGNEDGMQNLKAGLEALWHGLQSNSTTDIDQAIGALQSAQDQISSLLGNVGGQMANLDLQAQRHSSSQVFLQEQIDALDKVDITEAITRFTQEQASLEASMLVITQINRLSLVDFLR